MYATCLFCHVRLGSNEVVEAFPVGRRLAFDADKGRLWVVCPSCGRWNLTPLEERWEAIETCERLFRETRLRVSTEEIGMARVPEGLELVRIGRPQRPEMAAWRYGREFAHRYARFGAPSKVATGVAAAAGVAFAIGAALPLVGGMLAVGAFTAVILRDGIRRVRLPTDVGPSIRLSTNDLLAAALVEDAATGWAVRVQHRGATTLLTGEDGRRTAGVLLARLNRVGGTAPEIAQSVAYLERVQSPEAYFRRLARTAGPSVGVALATLPRDVALGLEMATHEASERRAMEGELAELEQAWRAAEEVAAIADRLLVPAAVSDWMADARRHRTP